MKNINKSKFKKHSQIFNLKKVLNNANNESYILLSKITELQKIFRNTKKIINEKINQLAKNNNNKLNSNEEQIKHQICEKINIIINKYQEGKKIASINDKKAEYKKLIVEKIKELNILFKKYKYKNLLKEKDLLIQTIKEKNNICESFKNQIEYEKDFGSIFQPKNIFFFDNLFNINNKYIKIDLEKIKKKKLNELMIQTNLNLKEIGVASLLELKKNKIKYLNKLNKYIYDKGFNYTFGNKRYNEKYNIEIELLNNSECSSDSDYDISEDESNNKLFFINQNKNNNNVINKKNNIITNKINKKYKNKIISLSSSEKDTNDQEKEIKKSDNLILIKQLVKLKEKYNKLINDRYDLDYKKKAIQKKISNIKKRTVASSSSLSMKSKIKTQRNKNYIFGNY